MPANSNTGISAGAYTPNPNGVLALDPTDIPGVDPLDPTGLIPAARMLAPLEVRIPQWGPPPEPLDTPHILTIYWARGGSVVYQDSKTVNAPPPALPLEHVMFIPLVVLRAQSGPVELYYSVTDSFGGITVLDPKRTLTVDMDEPQLLNPADHLEFVVPPSPAVGEAYLQNNDPVAFHVPPYTGRNDGDVIHFYLSNLPNPPVAGEDGTYEWASSSDPLIAYLSADKFRALSNGPAYIFHRIFDRAGNFSDLSAGLPFQLALIPLPGPRPLPEIFPPERYFDSLINREDARAGIFVRVNSYSDWAPGDQVRVYWKGRATPTQEVFGFPTDVPIDWAVLRGPLTDPLAAETVPVRYEIIRGSLPPFPSFAIPVNVNLTIAGQDHANAPALLNLDLPVAEVRGLVSNTPNVVNHDDNPAGARARVRLYENPLTGQLLRFFWNGVGPVATYTVQPGDVEGQLVFSTVIPWAVMEGVINPALPVYYTTSNGVNDQQSDNTFVNVNTGTLISFPAPVLKHTLVGAAAYLSCCSKPEVFYGVEWSIGPGHQFELNDVVRFFWEGYSSNNWAPPVIESSRYAESQSFNNYNDLANGLNVTVKPYEDKIVPMRNYGSARAWYQVRRGGVLIGESLSKYIRVDLNYPVGGYCKAGDVITCSNEGEATLVSRK
ncbi:hypothetical protein LRQ11_02370 [Pseudomonas sp. MAFF 311095]|uniref:Uncharacterized protein n=1 Tax=Pseudomonas petroselini TaxID=2899822 RepID=A0ABS8R1S0_9PSED|nr:hypothetical protein [Pseudomonas petroselini]MCD7041937.1 hypothetical protein [Pseudomonas petroselini]MCD7047443.1 hypothetical protein [Pseudomonas petroselini]MCD7070266.1 hypothetical protein [Pseudomonas petroselini]MCD7077825.1 hypothetical protein [Pseudomonas petroselini]